MLEKKSKKKNISLSKSEAYVCIKCPVAKKVYAVYETFEDIQEERKRHDNRRRHYGETAEYLGTSRVSFMELVKRRRKEERDLMKDMEALAETCPMYYYVRRDLNLSFGSWAFLISRCSPFRFNCIGKLVAMLGMRKSKSGKRYKTKDGKRLTKMTHTMRMRKAKPYQDAVNDELIPILREKHPDYTESYLKNKAWYNISFDEVLIPFYKRAQVTCNRCENNTNPLSGRY